jgi:hypothetical protein
MMKIPIFSIFAILVIQSQTDAQSDCSVHSLNFQPGEKLGYIVSYNWFVIWTEVGEVSFSVDKTKIADKPCYHLLGTGRTYSGWDLFFKVRDRYESWVNPDNLKPVYFKREVREGGYEIDIHYLFNRKKNYALSSSIVNKKPEEKDTLAITDCTFDVMSILYYARTLDYTQYKPDQIIPVTILLDRQLEKIYFRYKGIETIKIRRLGEFECIQLSVKLVAGTVFKGGESMTLWITNDKNKIPVFVESPVIVGSVKARLLYYDQLKYPLDSKIK